jgi:UDP-N-acetylmuramate: L-alanyl-gamma-D-glutamyl-meso-diaminopimelate ligase
MEPFTEADVQSAFKDNRIKFFDDVALLETYLTSMNYRDTNLLMMSSGNYSGLDLVNLARELNTFI